MGEVVDQSRLKFLGSIRFALHSICAGDAFGRSELVEIMPIAAFDNHGDLPPGIHHASLVEVSARFGQGSPQRQSATASLHVLHRLAASTGKLERFLVFGSYVTSKPDPNDIDIFLVMAEDFEINDYGGEIRDVFSHDQAHLRFGATVFWATRGTSPALLDKLIEAWQTKRDRSCRGILEVSA